MRNDALEEIENSIPDESDPNNRFGSGIIATLESISDTIKFCNTYTHENNYKDLKLGQLILIKGSNPSMWFIAGFDCEADNIASDGTRNNNGYGILLYPFSDIRYGEWDSSSNFISYRYSTAHTSILPEIADELQTILGSNLVRRRVLLSSNVDSNTGISTRYSWTTAYCTLPSIGQINGKFGQYRTIYDDGEANYQLPLFKAHPELLYDVRNGSYNVSRNIHSDTYTINTNVYFYEYVQMMDFTNGKNKFDINISNMDAGFTGWEYNPIIYIR